MLLGRWNGKICTGCCDPGRKKMKMKIYLGSSVYLVTATYDGVEAIAFCFYSSFLQVKAWEQREETEKDFSDVVIESDTFEVTFFLCSVF